MTRYEDHAPRLAGEATQGRWHHHPRLMWACVTSGRDGGGEVIVETYARTPNDAALIAYHHPARVVALAAVVRAAREVLRLHRRDSAEKDIAAAEAALDEALRRLDEEA